MEKRKAEAAMQPTSKYAMDMSKNFHRLENLAFKYRYSFTEQKGLKEWKKIDVVSKKTPSIWKASNVRVDTLKSAGRTSTFYGTKP